MRKPNFFFPSILLFILLYNKYLHSYFTHYTETERGFCLGIMLFQQIRLVVY